MGYRPDANDWRRQGQELFLNKVKLVKQNYKPYREGWEHDNCEFCGAKFSLLENDLKEGYTTLDNYHWICNDCFSDFLSEI